MPYKDPEKERARQTKKRATPKYKKYMQEYTQKRRATAHGKMRQAIADKAFREKHREKFNRYQRNWLRKRKIVNPEKALRASIAKRSRNMGGVIIDRLPPDKCEACKKLFANFSTPRQRIPQADHCHKTSNFRGWICYKCNSSLGFANDTREGLQLLIDYLVRTEIWL